MSVKQNNRDFAIFIGVKMDLSSTRRKNKYNRVMPRVYDRSQNNFKYKTCVTRHDIPSTTTVGAKPAVSNVSSSTFSELPLVLNDYIPDVLKQKKFVVKPKKTIRSLNPATSPQRIRATQNNRPNVSNLRVPTSAPVILNHGQENWPNRHLKDCYSSRSHNKLKELKVSVLVCVLLSFPCIPFTFYPRKDNRCS
jgi:hypothetical protein